VLLVWAAMNFIIIISMAISALEIRTTKVGMVEAMGEVMVEATVEVMVEAMVEAMVHLMDIMGIIDMVTIITASFEYNTNVISC
jgi:hypothetical protein